MKKYLLLFTVGTLLAASSAIAEPPPYQFAIDPKTGMPVAVTNTLPQFDLEFAGGTPKEFVKAIEKATAKPLSVVIPEETAKLTIPALSVKNVTVTELFNAATKACTRTAPYIVQRSDGTAAYGDYTESWGFRTEGIPHEKSIWYFYWDRARPHDIVAPTICQFFQLGPYLDAGYQVEDITTVIQTGWKMLGETKAPELVYHKDTRLLVAVGAKNLVEMIGEALKQLPLTPRAKTAKNEDAP